jgi:hypothetical protein
MRARRAYGSQLKSECRLFAPAGSSQIPSPLAGKVRIGGLRALAQPYTPSPCPSPARGEGTWWPQGRFYESLAKEEHS